MGDETTSLGGIHVSPNAVATIAYRATLESYGVVGLAPKNLADGIVSTITREPSRGVSVQYKGEDIDIDIHVVVEYGTRIATVAESVANTVRFHVEKARLKVNSVNVHVAGLRSAIPIRDETHAYWSARVERLRKKKMTANLKKLMGGLTWLRTIRKMSIH